MTWNYRVFEKKHEERVFKTEEEERREPWSSFDIREVFYETDGEIYAYTDPIAPYGETLEELETELHLFLEALKKPPLTKDCVRRVDDDVES